MDKEFREYALDILSQSLDLLYENLGIGIIPLSLHDRHDASGKNTIGLETILRWPKGDIDICVWAKDFESKESCKNKTLELTKLMLGLPTMREEILPETTRKLNSVIDLPEKAFHIACITAWLFNLGKAQELF